MYLKEIPISESDYRNNPQLLSAMIVTHLEDICEKELQVLSPLEETQQNEYRIANIHYGLTSQCCMRHLVAIYDAVLQIYKLKKRMKNDPSNKTAYEAESWKLYTRVTKHKDEYYKERVETTPSIRNAFITFRSMEGKQRAL